MGKVDGDTNLLPYRAGIDFINRTIFIGNIHDSGSLTPQIDALVRMSFLSPEPITLFIRSAGGDLEETILFTEIMRSVHSDIYGIAMDTCFSGGLVIFSFCKVRSCFYHTKFMAHQISLTEEGMSAADLSMQARKIKRENTLIYRIFEKASSKKVEWWKNKIKRAKDHDYYFDVNEAGKIGLINGEVFDQHNPFRLPPFED